MAEHLLLALPTHSETITVQTATTLITLTSMLERRGSKLSVEWFSGSVIAEVRNILTSVFIECGADRMFMLDSDQGLPGELLTRFLDSDKDLVGCMYPKRRLDWSSVSYPVGDMETAQYQASDFVGKLESNRSDVLQFDVVNGMAKAVYIGGGAMMVKKRVIDRMKVRYPDLKGEGYVGGSLKESKFQNNWGFFNHLSTAEVGQQLAEDYAFCHRWRVGCGGEIWADVVTNTQHVGRYVYSGNYLNYARVKFGEALGSASKT